ncbi:MAG: TetR/AcrR family transcriptional regulator [Candidatus Cloacimonetes bacterium]|nr:TetR/AcrR family transcriptional regulator [Candidatus Cloacimonadota bacterium]
MVLTERQQQIVDISIELIAQQGIQNLTIKNIARKAGFSEPALYRHFASKFDIVMAMLESFQNISRFVLSETEKEELDSIGKIEKFLFDRYQRFSANPAAARVMFAEGLFMDDNRYSQRMLDIMHQHAGSMQNIIREGQLKGELRTDIPAREMFRIIFGSLRLLISQWCLADYNFDLLLEGKLLWNAVRKMIC